MPVVRSGLGSRQGGALPGFNVDQVRLYLIFHLSRHVSLERDPEAQSRQKEPIPGYIIKCIKPHETFAAKCGRYRIAACSFSRPKKADSYKVVGFIAYSEARLVYILVRLRLGSHVPSHRRTQGAASVGREVIPRNAVSKRHTC